MSVGFVYPYDQNKPDQRRKSALHPPTNTCAPGRSGRAKDQRRLAARIKWWDSHKNHDSYHKPGSLKK